MKNLQSKIITIKNTNNVAIQLEDFNNDKIVAIPFNHIYINSNAMTISKNDISDYKQENITCNQVSKCNNCGYVGNKAMWRGILIKDNKQYPIEGVVTLLYNNIWNLNNITNLKYDNYKGKAYCPICNSEDIY